MKLSPLKFSPGVAVAWFLAVALVAFAQEKPAAAETPAAPADPAVTPAPAAAPAEPPLRRLDAPDAGTEKSPAPAKAKLSGRPNRMHVGSRNGNERVSIGGDARLGPGESADAVVAVFGSATSEGDVADAVVSVFGDTRVTGPAGDVAVAVFGSTYVNSKVGNAVVAVFGDVELGPEAEVGGDVVAVGGMVKCDPKAIVHGQIHNVSFAGKIGRMDGLREWFTRCLLYGRPLAFGPHLGWAWGIALAFLALYVLLALIFGQGVNQCVATLETRPGNSILTAFLSILLAPVVMILLILTGVGIALVPFLGMALFFAALFGKAVMLAWLGRRITRAFGDSLLGGTAVAVLVGGIIVLLLYTVPVLGFLTYKLLGWLGTGVVIYTVLQSMKRERAARPVVPPPLVRPNSPPMSAPTAVENFSAPVDAMGAPAGGSAEPGPAPEPTLAAAFMARPPVLSAVTMPRAGFWIRIAALALDAVLIGLIAGGVFRHGGRPAQIVLGSLAIYAALMWKLKGTTIGGVICGLKVVRLDDRPLDWTTAIVRTLSCVLSGAVVGLGFIWVAFDDEKQSWHDKIAGTTVVRVPKGVSLL